MGRAEAAGHMAWGAAGVIKADFCEREGILSN